MCDMWIPLLEAPPEIIHRAKGERHMNGTFPTDGEETGHGIPGYYPRLGSWPREEGPRAAAGEVLLIWHVFQGAMLCRAEDLRENRFFRYWQHIPREGWILSEERRPARADADGNRCVLAEHYDWGLKITGWHHFSTDPRWYLWMPTPEPPEDYRQLRTSMY